MDSSWSLNQLATGGIIRREIKPTRPCPRCQAPSEFEEFTSTKTDPPTRRRMIRCPNAKGKEPTCTVTIEDVEEQDVPKITPELKERITILKNCGITQKQIADRAGYADTSFSTFVSGSSSLKHEKIEEAVTHFELNEVGPPLPLKGQKDLTSLIQAANAAQHSHYEQPTLKLPPGGLTPDQEAELRRPSRIEVYNEPQQLSVEQLVDQLCGYPAELRAEILQLVEEQVAVNERRAILARLAKEVA